MHQCKNTCKSLQICQSTLCTGGAIIQLPYLYYLNYQSILLIENLTMYCNTDMSSMSLYKLIVFPQDLLLQLSIKIVCMYEKQYTTLNLYTRMLHLYMREPHKSALVNMHVFGFFQFFWAHLFFQEDQKIVRNSFRPTRFIITQNHIH